MNIESKKWFYILITVILITEYSDKFAGKSKIYSNGGSEVWR